MRQKTGAPEPPESLKPDARARWLFVAPTLARRGLVDVDVLASYCLAFARWRAAEAGLAQTGMLLKDKRGDVKASPLIRISHQAWAQVRQLETRLGIAPPDVVSLSPGLLTRRQVADLLGVHQDSVSRLLADGLAYGVVRWGGRSHPMTFSRERVMRWHRARQCRQGRACETCWFVLEDCQAVGEHLIQTRHGYGDCPECDCDWPLKQPCSASFAAIDGGLVS
jgi:P27 family predicted phage terminase small subunit